MSNFLLIFSCSNLSIGPYAVSGVEVALACSACSSDIDDLFWSLCA